MPEGIADRMLERLSEDIAERMSQDGEWVSADLPARMSEDTLDRMEEYLPDRMMSAEDIAVCQAAWQKGRQSTSQLVWQEEGCQKICNF